MLEKISNMERNDKFKLTIVFILLVFTIIVAVAPLINKHKNYTREELREKSWGYSMGKKNGKWHWS